MPTKRKSTGVETNEDLKFDGKKRQHEREQNAMDVAFKVITYLIIIVPICIILWYVILMSHYLYINDYASFKDVGFTTVKIVVSYFVGLLTQLGILKLHDRQQDSE